MITPIGLILVGAGGAVVASFATTAALRSLRQEQALTGRSRCDGCAAPLRFAATMPVISFVALGGACRTCGSRIDRAHPTGELLGAAAALLAAALLPPAQAFLAFGLALVLLTAGIIDLRTKRLPDQLTLAAAALSLSLAALGGLDRLIAGLIAAVATFVLLEALRRGFAAARRKPGLGFGDVKLLAALSLWLGTATPWAVALASVLGLAMAIALRPADGRVPFGPAIALAAWSLGLAIEAGLAPTFLTGGM